MRGDKAAVRAGIVTAGWAAIAAGLALLERTGPGATRLLDGILVFAGLALLAWAVRGGLRNALVVACSLVFGFAVLEGAMLGLGLTAKRPPKLQDSSLGGARPAIGWGPTKVGTFRWAKVGPDGAMIYDTRVTVDAHLNRQTVPSDGPRPIAFWGDSWIFGDGVEDDGTLPQAFADLIGGRIPVLNLAYNGWSPATNLVALDTGLYADLLREPRHFFLFTAAFHLERTGCKADYATSAAPRYVLEDGEVRFTGPCSAANGGWLAPVLRFLRRFEIYNRFAPKLATPGRRDVETYLAIIEAFVSEARRKYGVATTVLMPDWGDNYIKGSGTTVAEIIAALRKAGVDVLIDKVPTEDPRYWIAGDGHPSKAGNEARARLLETHLREVDPQALEVLPQTSGR